MPWKNLRLLTPYILLCFLDLASILLDTLTLLLNNVKPTLFFTDLDVTAHYRLAVMIKE